LKVVPAHDSRLRCHMCVSYNRRQLCRCILYFNLRCSYLQFRTTFSHNVKTVRKGRFQFQGLKWTDVDFNFVISQLYTRYLSMATRCC